MPARTLTKSSQKVESLKQSNKVNKNIIIAKTLEAITPEAKFDAFKYTYFKNMFKANFSFINRSSVKSARPEKNSLALEDRLTQKMTEKLMKCC